MMVLKTILPLYRMVSAQLIAAKTSGAKLRSDGTEK
jgi:hypothetical protein